MFIVAFSLFGALLEVLWSSYNIIYDNYPCKIYYWWKIWLLIMGLTFYGSFLLIYTTILIIINIIYRNIYKYTSFLFQVKSNNYLFRKYTYINLNEYLSLFIFFLKEKIFLVIKKSDYLKKNIYFTLKNISYSAIKILKTKISFKINFTLIYLDRYNKSRKKKFISSYLRISFAFIFFSSFSFVIKKWKKKIKNQNEIK